MPPSIATGSYAGTGAIQSIATTIAGDGVIAKSRTSTNGQFWYVRDWSVYAIDRRSCRMQEGADLNIANNAIRDMVGASFEVGTSGNVNALGETFDYAVFTRGAHFDFGRIAGDGVAARVVPTGLVTSTPLAVAILRERSGAVLTAYRTNTMIANSRTWVNCGPVTAILGFGAGSFTLDVSYNGIGNDYTWFAWGDVPDIETIRYIGNGVANRTVGGLTKGITPAMGIIVAEETAPPLPRTGVRFAGMPDNLCMNISAGIANSANRLQRFAVNNFEVSTNAGGGGASDENVNDNTGPTPYDYLVWGLGAAGGGSTGGAARRRFADDPYLPRVR